MTTAALAAPHTRLRLTVRGRRVFAGLAALPVVAGLAVAAIAGGGAAIGADEPAPADAFETITVLSGDSLWTIAESIAPGHDPRDVVDAITELNQLPGGALVAGHELAIPAEFTAG
jgi:Tfp pilus assembly protein FimV